MAAAAPDIEAHPEVVGVLPSLGGGVPEGEPEAVLINPVGLKATLDKVVNPDTGITLAMVVDDNVSMYSCRIDVEDCRDFVTINLTALDTIESSWPNRSVEVRMTD